MSNKETKEEMGFSEAIKKGVHDGKNDEEIGNKIEENIDKWAEGLEDKIEKNIDEKIPKFIEPLIGMIMMIIMLVLVNIFWDRFRFITEDFTEVLPIWNFTVVVSILVQFVRIFYQKCWFKVFTDWINTFLFIYVAYVVWNVYPFDTSVFNDPELWNTLIKILIVGPPILGTIGVLTTSVKALTSGGEKCK